MTRLYWLREQPSAFSLTDIKGTRWQSACLCIHLFPLYALPHSLRHTHTHTEMNKHALKLPHQVFIHSIFQFAHLQFGLFCSYSDLILGCRKIATEREREKEGVLQKGEGGRNNDKEWRDVKGKQNEDEERQFGGNK